MGSLVTGHSSRQSECAPQASATRESGRCFTTYGRSLWQSFGSSYFSWVFEYFRVFEYFGGFYLYFGIKAGRLYSAPEFLESSMSKPTGQGEPNRTLLFSLD